MVYLIKDNGKQILYGLSTDDKDASLDLVTTKTDVIVYREVDTGKEYIYNTGEWYEQAGSGGGGGGGGGEIDLGITGASVGEYAKIKTVDADGAPTAWESGGGGGVLIVNDLFDEQTGITIDKTVQEIIDAYDAGMVILFHELIGSRKTRFYLSGITIPVEEGDKYHVTVFTGDEFAEMFGMDFVADNASDYPVVIIP